MAAPHAAGVAALIISRYGRPDPVHKGGITLSPSVTEQILKNRAGDRPCPEGGVLDYADLPDSFTAVCEGTMQSNGFYGEGMVDARRSVLIVRRPTPPRLKEAGTDLP
jgi:subtilisin family serine protease